MALAPKLKQMIGKAFPERVVEVEKSQIRRFAASVGEDNAVHFDEAAAKAAGFTSIIGPPTFVAALINTDYILEELGWDPQAIMHRAEEYEFFAPVTAGAVLTITQRVTDIYEQEAVTGNLVFAVIESRIHDKKDKPVMKGRRVLVKLRS